MRFLISGLVMIVIMSETADQIAGAQAQNNNRKNASHFDAFRSCADP
jgi:hypothetical protein